MKRVAVESAILAALVFSVAACEGDGRASELSHGGRHEVAPRQVPTGTGGGVGSGGTFATSGSGGSGASGGSGGTFGSGGTGAGGSGGTFGSGGAGGMNTGGTFR
jgi:hypothetical protein